MALSMTASRVATHSAVMQTCPTSPSALATTRPRSLARSSTWPPLTTPVAVSGSVRFGVGANSQQQLASVVSSPASKYPPCQQQHFPLTRLQGHWPVDLWRRVPQGVLCCFRQRQQPVWRCREELVDGRESTATSCNIQKHSSAKVGCADFPSTRSSNDMIT